jgi:hypothetical protein
MLIIVLSKICERGRNDKAISPLGCQLITELASTAFEVRFLCVRTTPFAATNINPVSVEANWRILYQAPVAGVPVEKAYDWANDVLRKAESAEGSKFLKALLKAVTVGGIRGSNKDKAPASARK